MKNYEVEAIKRFTDKEEGVRRDFGDRFVCTESRFNVLKQNNAVKLIEIIKEDPVVTEDELQEIKIVRENNFDVEIKEEDLQDTALTNIVEKIVTKETAKKSKKKTSKK